MTGLYRNKRQFAVCLRLSTPYVLISSDQTISIGSDSRRRSLSLFLSPGRRCARSSMGNFDAPSISALMPGSSLACLHPSAGFAHIGGSARSLRGDKKPLSTGDNEIGRVNETNNSQTRDGIHMRTCRELCRAGHSAVLFCSVSAHIYSFLGARSCRFHLPIPGQIYVLRVAV